jgi:hypothetical protein
MDLVVTDGIVLFANALRPGPTAGAHLINRNRGAANITRVGQCGGIAISLEAARFIRCAAIIRNAIGLLRVDTLNATFAITIGINRLAIRANAYGVIAAAFLVHPTIRSRVDASVGELNALGTSVPQIRSIRSTMKCGEIYPP